MIEGIIKQCALRIYGVRMLHVKRKAMRSSALCTAAELRRLAEESLALLKEFLFDERFPALFDLEVYGSIVGMFELNNLSEPLLRQSCYPAHFQRHMQYQHAILAVVMARL